MTKINLYQEKPLFLAMATLMFCFLMIGCGTKLSNQDAKTTTPQNANAIGMEFKPLSGGTFTMGSDDDARQVTLSKTFELGVYEVTQEQYEKVMGKGNNPSEFKGAQNPVERVGWDAAIEFCRKLSELPEEKSAGRVYRLPTEAEWEYACRAGTTTAYSFGDDESQIGDYAWYLENSGGNSHPVGQKKPNPWGFYDMHGNVREWCQDYHGKLAHVSVTDPMGPKSGSYRVSRGGGWGSGAGYCRSSDRRWPKPTSSDYYLGFRVARVSVNKPSE